MIEFNKRILKNGMTILCERRNQPIVSVFVSVKQGAGNENLSQKGISHFVEHMLFKGTKRRTSKELSSEIERTGGMINGGTDIQNTLFYLKAPSKYLELGIDILSDMIQNPKFSSLDIEKERKIIFEEIKMMHDIPSAYVVRKLTELLYAPPFGDPIIGNFETLSKISKQNLISLHSTYIPKNLIVCVVGNASIGQVQELAERKFNIKNNNSKILMPKIRKISMNVIEKRQNLDQAHLAIGFHMPSAIEASTYAAQIFDSILAQGMSSKINQEIREKRALAYSVDGVYESGKDYGMEMIYAGTLPNKIRLAKELILKEVNKMKNLNLREFNETKEKLIGNFELSREKSTDVARNLIADELGLGAEEYYNFIKKISAVKLNDARKIAKNIKNFSSIILLPK